MHTIDTYHNISLYQFFFQILSLEIHYYTAEIVLLKFALVIMLFRSFKRLLKTLKYEPLL